MLSYSDSLADTACKLECCQDLAPIHEFVGPVKIVLMDVPKEVYLRKAWIAALIGLAHMLVAITVMTVLFYTLSFKTPLMMNLHIVLCTVGFQLFMPSAILMVSNLHGPATILKPQDRKFQHLFLQIFGISFATAGSILIMLFGPGSFSSKFSLHSITDPDSVYCKSVFCAILVTVSTMLRAATLMCLFMYCLHTGFKDWHVLLCTFGFHFFSAEAILGLNYANGWSTPMRIRHRKFAHVFLQLCGLICSIAGTVLVLLSKDLSGSAHGITGIITMTLAGLGLLSGPFTFLPHRITFYVKIVHMSIGMPTFFASSLCICMGFLTSAFKSWATATLAYILIGFVSFYTALIVFTVFIKCVSRV